MKHLAVISLALVTLIFSVIALEHITAIHTYIWLPNPSLLSQRPPMRHPKILTKTKAPRPSHPWYTISEINAPHGDIAAINDYESIVGRGYLNNQHLGAVIWSQNHTTALGTLPGSAYSEALALNNHNQVLADSDERLFLWKKGKITPVPRLEGSFAFRSCGLNDNGQIVGVARSTILRRRGGDLGGMMPVTHAFLLQAGKLTDLGALSAPAQDSTPHALNNRGQVVGDSDGRAFLWDKGSMHNLGTLSGFDSSSAVAINNQGQAVGTCTGSQNMGGAIWGDAFEEPFLWQNGKMADLGTLPGCTKTFALGIDDQGHVIGRIIFIPNFNDKPPIPLLWYHGKIYDLNDLIPPQTGIGIAYPCAISSRGLIVCVGYRDAAEREGISHNYIPHIFLLTPATAH